MDPGFLAAAVQRKGPAYRRAERRRVDAPAKLCRKRPWLHPALLLQDRAQRLHAFQNSRMLLLPALGTAAAMGTQRIMGVINDPTEALAPAGQPFVDLVHRLCQ